MADQNTKADAPIAEKVAEAVATDVPAKPDMKKIDAAVEAVSKPQKAEAKKAAPKKAAAKKKPAAKKAAPKKAVKKAATKAKKPAAKKSPTNSQTKEPKMATKKTTTKKTETMQDKAKTMFADMSTRAQGVYGNAREYAGEAVEFSKGNVEAVVKSGKILAEGMQGMAKGAVETGREAVETMTADAKDFAAVRSPSELVQLNSKIASRNFDALVAQTSKNVEAWTKLATDAFAPIQDRVSIAVEKVRKAA